MFFGRPVIAFRIGGIPEVISDAGFLHEFGDVAGMAGSLDALMDSPETANDIGGRGQARAGKLFTAEQVVPQYEALYRSVLGR